MNVSKIIYFITNFIRNQEIDRRLEAHFSKYPTATRTYPQVVWTPKNITVIKLPDNIDHLPVKIKKILNISRDLIEISEYCDEMIEYNKHIIKKF